MRERVVEALRGGRHRGRYALAVDLELGLAAGQEGHEGDRGRAACDEREGVHLDSLSGQRVAKPVAPGVVAGAADEAHGGARAPASDGDVGERAAEVRAELVGVAKRGDLALADEVDERLAEADDRVACGGRFAACHRHVAEFTRGIQSGVLWVW